MNFSLNRLCSLIPESFRNQVNQGNTRVDKIKIVDIAILYVEHLHEVIGRKTNLDECAKKPNEADEPKKDAQTSTTDLTPISITNNIDLNYIKGFFNGTIEYLSYLIEHNILNQINKPEQAVQGDELIVIFNIELYVNILRKFHAIYFNKIQLSPECINSVISNVTNAGNPHSLLSFPLNNKKLIKKILHILSLYSDQNHTNLIKYYKKIYEYVLLDNRSGNEKLNMTNSSSNGLGQYHSMPISESSFSSRSSSTSSSSENFSDSEASESEKCYKKSKNTEIEASVAITSSKLTETKPESILMKQPVKKLKSNLIERFSSTNQDAEDAPVPVQVQGQSLIHTTGQEKEEMLSIFILHSSHDFYLSGCLDKSLLDSSLLKNVIKNPEFKPKSVQKIRLDVVFGADIVIKKDNSVSTFSQYASVISNKRKLRDPGSFIHPSLRKYSYNLSEENRILESYLRAIRKAHDKKKQLNGSKYDNLTIMYKNYSRAAKNDNEDQVSVKTFYTV